MCVVSSLMSFADQIRAEISKDQEKSRPLFEHDLMEREDQLFEREVERLLQNDLASRLIAPTSQPQRVVLLLPRHKRE